MTPKIPLNPSQKAIVAIAIVAGVLCATAVMLRVLARHISNRKLISSDYIIIPACVWNPDFSASPPPPSSILDFDLLIMFRLQASAVAYQTVIGFSKVHIATVTATPPSVQLTDLPLLAQILFSVQLIYTISISLTKLSILELYRQIFPTRVMAVICFGVQALVILWALATVLVTFTLCQPLAYNWDTTIEGGRCGDTLASWKSTGIVNILTDVFVLVIPGSKPSTTAVGIARLVSIVHVDFTDITYSVAWACLYSALECSVAVTLSCIPLLRPLLGRGSYSNNGTARVQPTTWKGGVAISSTKKKVNNKESFRRIKEDTSELELCPQ
ncbi:hypothetical protein PG987_016394, partial [Apiospora arundinis]